MRRSTDAVGLMSGDYATVNESRAWGFKLHRSPLLHFFFTCLSCVLASQCLPWNDFVQSQRSTEVWNALWLGSKLQLQESGNDQGVQTYINNTRESQNLCFAHQLWTALSHSSKSSAKLVAPRTVEVIDQTFHSGGMGWILHVVLRTMTRALCLPLWIQIHTR